ncbi:hypothetical protein RUND412_003429 [Rhizina undulata]
MAHLADAKSLLDSRGLYEGATIHGVNPLLLVEKIIRERIFESLYWKEQTFGLNAATLLDRATELTYIGGQYSNQKPTPFLCLVFKLLQLQPPREIVLEYLHDPEFKYLRALAAFYIRLTWKAVDIFKTLEPLMTDYRKLRVRGMGGWSLTYTDEFIDDLLTKERVCDIALPHIKTRAMLEDAEELEPRDSALGSELESEEEGGDEEGGVKKDGGIKKEEVEEAEVKAIKEEKEGDVEVMEKEKEKEGEVEVMEEEKEGEVEVMEEEKEGEVEVMEEEKEGEVEVMEEEKEEEVEVMEEEKEGEAEVMEEEKEEEVEVMEEEKEGEVEPMEEGEERELKIKAEED